VRVCQPYPLLRPRCLAVTPCMVVLACLCYHHRYCNGGLCTVDGYVWASNLENTLAF
jgi:hypothetical protein